MSTHQQTGIPTTQFPAQTAIDKSQSQGGMSGMSLNTSTPTSMHPVSSSTHFLTGTPTQRYGSVLGAGGDDLQANKFSLGTPVDTGTRVNTSLAASNELAGGLAYTPIGSLSYPHDSQAIAGLHSQGQNQQQQQHQLVGLTPTMIGKQLNPTIRSTLPSSSPLGQQGTPVQVGQGTPQLYSNGLPRQHQQQQQPSHAYRPQNATMGKLKTPFMGMNFGSMDQSDAATAFDYTAPLMGFPSAAMGGSTAPQHSHQTTITASSSSSSTGVGGVSGGSAKSQYASLTGGSGGGGSDSTLSSSQMTPTSNSSSVLGSSFNLSSHGHSSHHPGGGTSGYSYHDMIPSSKQQNVVSTNGYGGHKALQQRQYDTSTGPVSKLHGLNYQTTTAYGTTVEGSGAIPLHQTNIINGGVQPQIQSAHGHGHGQPLDTQKRPRQQQLLGGGTDLSTLSSLVQLPYQSQSQHHHHQQHSSRTAALAADDKTDRVTAKKRSRVDTNDTNTRRTTSPLSHQTPSSSSSNSSALKDLIVPIHSHSGRHRKHGHRTKQHGESHNTGEQSRGFQGGSDSGSSGTTSKKKKAAAVTVAEPYQYSGILTSKLFQNYRLIGTEYTLYNGMTIWVEPIARTCLLARINDARDVIVNEYFKDKSIPPHHYCLIERETLKINSERRDMKKHLLHDARVYRVKQIQMIVDAFDFSNYPDISLYPPVTEAEAIREYLNSIENEHNGNLHDHSPTTHGDTFASTIIANNTVQTTSSHRKLKHILPSHPSELSPRTLYTYKLLHEFGMIPHHLPSPPMTQTVPAHILPLLPTTGNNVPYDDSQPIATRSPLFEDPVEFLDMLPPQIAEMVRQSPILNEEIIIPEALLMQAVSAANVQFLVQPLLLPTINPDHQCIDSTQDPARCPVTNPGMIRLDVYKEHEFDKYLPLLQRAASAPFNQPMLTLQQLHHIARPCHAKVDLRRRDIRQQSESEFNRPANIQELRAKYNLVIPVYVVIEDILPKDLTNPVVDINLRGIIRSYMIQRSQSQAIMSNNADLRGGQVFMSKWLNLSNYSSNIKTNVSELYENEDRLRRWLSVQPPIDIPLNYLEIPDSHGHFLLLQDPNAKKTTPPAAGQNPSPTAQMISGSAMPASGYNTTTQQSFRQKYQQDPPLSTPSSSAASQTTTGSQTTTVPSNESSQSSRGRPSLSSVPSASIPGHHPTYTQPIHHQGGKSLQHAVYPPHPQQTTAHAPASSHSKFEILPERNSGPGKASAAMASPFISQQQQQQQQQQQPIYTSSAPSYPTPSTPSSSSAALQGSGASSSSASGIHPSPLHKTVGGPTSHLPFSHITGGQAGGKNAYQLGIGAGGAHGGQSVTPVMQPNHGDYTGRSKAAAAAAQPLPVVGQGGKLPLSLYPPMASTFPQGLTTPTSLLQATALPPASDPVVRPMAHGQGGGPHQQPSSSMDDDNVYHSSNTTQVTTSLPSTGNMGGGHYGHYGHGSLNSHQQQQQQHQISTLLYNQHAKKLDSFMKLLKDRPKDVITSVKHLHRFWRRHHRSIRATKSKQEHQKSTEQSDDKSPNQKSNKTDINIKEEHLGMTDSPDIPSDTIVVLAPKGKPSRAFTKKSIPKLKKKRLFAPSIRHIIRLAFKKTSQSPHAVIPPICSETLGALQVILSTYLTFSYMLDYDGHLLSRNVENIKENIFHQIPSKVSTPLLSNLNYTNLSRQDQHYLHKLTHLIPIFNLTHPQFLETAAILSRVLYNFSPKRMQCPRPLPLTTGLQKDMLTALPAVGDPASVAAAAAVVAGQDHSMTKHNKNHMYEYDYGSDALTVILRRDYAVNHQNNGNVSPSTSNSTTTTSESIATIIKIDDTSNQLGLTDNKEPITPSKLQDTLIKPFMKRLFDQECLHLVVSPSLESMNTTLYDLFQRSSPLYPLPMPSPKSLQSISTLKQECHDDSIVKQQPTTTTKSEAETSSQMVLPPVSLIASPFFVDITSKICTLPDHLQRFEGCSSLLFAIIYTPRHGQAIVEYLNRNQSGSSSLSSSSSSSLSYQPMLFCSVPINPISNTLLAQRYATPEQAMVDHFPFYISHQQEIHLVPNFSHYAGLQQSSSSTTPLGAASGADLANGGHSSTAMGDLAIGSTLTPMSTSRPLQRQFPVSGGGGGGDSGMLAPSGLTVASSIQSNLGNAPYNLPYTNFRAPQQQQQQGATVVSKSTMGGLHLLGGASGMSGMTSSSAMVSTPTGISNAFDMKKNLFDVHGYKPSMFHEPRLGSTPNLSSLSHQHLQTPSTPTTSGNPIMSSSVRTSLSALPSIIPTGQALPQTPTSSMASLPVGQPGGSIGVSLRSLPVSVIPSTPTSTTRAPLQGSQGGGHVSSVMGKPNAIVGNPPPNKPT